MGTLPGLRLAGAQLECRKDLGMVVVGGLLFSQFVTLFLTPVVYVYLDQLAAASAGATCVARRAVHLPARRRPPAMMRSAPTPTAW